jgi:dihydropyrimidinase
MYPKKGALKAGSDADIVVFDPKENGVITAENSLSKCGYEPFEGMRTVGKIEKVFLRGRLAYQDGEVVLEHTGKFVRRSKNSLML